MKFLLVVLKFSFLLPCFLTNLPCTKANSYQDWENIVRTLIETSTHIKKGLRDIANEIKSLKVPALLPNITELVVNDQNVTQIRQRFIDESSVNKNVLKCQESFNNKLEALINTTKSQTEAGVAQLLESLQDSLRSSRLELSMIKNRLAQASREEIMKCIHDLVHKCDINHKFIPIIKKNEKMLKEWGRKGWLHIHNYIQSLLNYLIDLDVKYEIVEPMDKCLKLQDLQDRLSLIPNVYQLE